MFDILSEFGYLVQTQFESIHFLTNIWVSRNYLKLKNRVIKPEDHQDTYGSIINSVTRPFQERTLYKTLNGISVTGIRFSGFSLLQRLHSAPQFFFTWGLQDYIKKLLWVNIASYFTCLRIVGKKFLRSTTNPTIFRFSYLAPIIDFAEGHQLSSKQQLGR